jgi:hypothetical protein
MTPEEVDRFYFNALAVALVIHPDEELVDAHEFFENPDAFLESKIPAIGHLPPA